MNCNEEFVIKAIGKLTLEFNFDWDQQRKVRDALYYSLYNYQVTSLEKALIKGDVREKIFLYIKVKKLAGYSEQTLKNYEYILERVATFINKPVATITTNDLRMFLIVNSEGKKASTINSHIFYIKAFFSWLELEELIPKSPAKRLETTKLPKRLRKSLNIEELERLRIACIDNRERALVEFLFATGCRVSEVVKCNVEDLDFSSNTLRVIGKGDKERIVCFNDKTKVYIKKYLNSRQDLNPALFIGIRKPYNRLGKRAIEIIIHKIADRAGFTKSVFPHLLRHTMATLGFQGGASLTTIQHLLGHSSPETSLIYAENSMENIQHEYKQHMIG